MDRENIAAGIQEVVPILFIPKQCTKLEMNCEMSENVYIDLSITSPDTEGNETCIYSGFCNVKLIESCNINIYPTETVQVEQENSSNSSIDCEDINQMPIVLSDANTFPTESNNQSQVWIDPSRSPHVYNHYDSTSQQTYSVVESSGCITVQQHNTYITQNVFNYDRKSQYKHLEQNKISKVPKAQSQRDCPEIYFDDDESESEMFLSQLSKRNKKTKDLEELDFVSVQGKNDALKQLMSTDIQSSSKQRKTILFLGESSTSGQTIQNILYTDPMVKCSALEVDHEVVIEEAQSPTPKKKKYQCDKCKQIFEQISAFRQHMVGNHTNYKVQNKDYTCPECGKKFSNNLKYEMHCLGHGDPDLECPKCHKVYASKNNLKVHMKIHNRKFPCPYCSRSYACSESYKAHLKIHSKFVCQFDECYFIANSESRLDDHHDDHYDDHHNNHVDDYRVGDHNNNNYHVEIENDHDGDDYQETDDHYNQCNDQVSDDHNDDANNDHIDKHLNIKESSDTEIDKSFLNDFSEDFERDLITTECELKTEMTGELDNEHKVERVVIVMERNISEEVESNERKEKINENEVKRNENKETERNKNAEAEINDMTNLEKNNDQDERVKRADSVIAKVMSNKIFLLNSKTAKKHAMNNKTCQVCSKSFDRVGDLKRHLIEHIVKSTLAKAVSSYQGTLNINCEICQLESFNTIDRYKAHLREHAKLTLYKCTFCDKSFSDSSNFSKHKKIHGVSYFQCDLCHRRFNSKVMISKHIELHNKNKPLRCKLCHRYFHFESMLKKHVKSVHSKRTSSRFPCRFCGVDFKTLKEKWDHEWVVHNIRKMIVDCLVCGAKFRKFSELKKHCLEEHEMDIPTQKKLLRKTCTPKIICVIKD